MNSPWAKRRAADSLIPRSLTTRPLVYGGNRIELLTGGKEFFPRLIAAIAEARQSIYLETYIFELDTSGAAVADALAAAAQRGVAVRVLVDGFGSANTIATLNARFAPSGARLIAFRPAVWWRLERRLLRRLHRKIALIDSRLAFVGGINMIDDNHHPGFEGIRLGPRYDFAVACQGPLVAVIAFTVKRLWWTVSPADRAIERSRPQYGEPSSPLPDNMRASLLLRDNLRHRRTIQRAYLDGVDRARETVVIANAYFLPGRRLRHALCEAARRGVRVQLLLQGRIEYRLQHYAQQSLYEQLLAAGVEIHEYTASYLHAKVAVIDRWAATVGSSNIDPYSLLLAREANVAVFDARFGQQLHDELSRAMQNDATAVLATVLQSRSWWKRMAYRLAYRLVRVLTYAATSRFED